MTDIIIVCSIITTAFILFATDRIRVDIVAMGIMVTLIILGHFRPNFVTYDEGISGFSNRATVTVAAMFVLSAALVKTGAISLIGDRLIRISGNSETLIFICILLTAGLVSAFINNTAAVAVFMPIILMIARTYKLSPSKMLMPLSYVSIFGGTCTLIGTSTNILVSSMAADRGYPEFAMFELSKLGLIFFAIGFLYLFFIVRPVLPHRVKIGSLTSKYQLGSYLTSLIVTKDSPLVGKTPIESRINSRYDVTILDIIRNEQHIRVGIRDTSLREGDILLVRGSVDGFLAMKTAENVLIRSEAKFADQDLTSEDVTLAEAIIAPGSFLVGKTLKQADFRHKYGAFALAIRKHGKTIRKKVGHIRLAIGDTLLLQGRKGFIENLASDNNFLVLQELQVPNIRTEKALYALLIIGMVIALAALNVIPIMVSALLGCLLMLATRCLTIQEAYESVDWMVIFLLAGVIPLGIAMEKTGTAQFIAHGLIDLIKALGPFAVISAFYILTSIFTEVLSNNASAVVMVPIALASAEEMGMNATPFLMAVAFAASASFATPFGYQTNLMVYGPGGYRFSDYVKVGVPLNLLFWLIASLMIPLIWPLEP